MKLTNEQVIDKLNQIKAIASEHFTDYLIVVMDDEHGVFDTYSRRVAAHGLASMVSKDIEADWQSQRNELSQ